MPDDRNNPNVQGNIPKKDVQRDQPGQKGLTDWGNKGGETKPDVGQQGQRDMGQTKKPMTPDREGTPDIGREGGEFERKR